MLVVSNKISLTFSGMASNSLSSSVYRASVMVPLALAIFKAIMLKTAS